MAANLDEFYVNLKKCSKRNFPADFGSGGVAKLMETASDNEGGEPLRFGAAELGLEVLYNLDQRECFALMCSRRRRSDGYDCGASRAVSSDG